MVSPSTGSRSICLVHCSPPFPSGQALAPWIGNPSYLMTGRQSGFQKLVLSSCAAGEKRMEQGGREMGERDGEVGVDVLMWCDEEGERLAFFFSTLFIYLYIFFQRQDFLSSCGAISTSTPACWRMDQRLAWNLSNQYSAEFSNNGPGRTLRFFLPLLPLTITAMNLFAQRLHIKVALHL